MTIDYLNRLEQDLRKAAATRAPRHAGARVGAFLAPRLLIVAAAVLLMGGSLALAFGGRVLTALGDGPAPPHVKSEFARITRPPYPLDGAPPNGYLPGKIVRGSQRRVLSIRTSNGKLASLYVARTTSGKTCYISSGGPFGSGGCFSGSPLQGPFSGFSTGIRSSRPGDKAHLGRGLTILGRAAAANATTVRVAYAGGGHDDVPLVQGWFMFEVPAAHTTRAAAPLRVDVLAADGTRLGSVNDPFRLHAPKPHFTLPVPSSIKLLASAALPNGGGTVRIWSGHDAQGHDCFRKLRNGRSQQGPIWQCTAMVGRYGYPVHPTTGKQRAPVQWQMGLSNDPRRPTTFGYAYAYGWVSPRVARLTVRFQDASATDIPLAGRYYLYVVPRDHWAAGHRPSFLEARDAQGKLISRQFLYPRQHCIYPGRDPVCHNFAMGTG